MCDIILIIINRDNFPVHQLIHFYRWYIVTRIYYGSRRDLVGEVSDK